MCECLKREDGTWHVDECCADVMDDWHSGKPFPLPSTLRPKVINDAHMLLAWLGMAENGDTPILPNEQWELNELKLRCLALRNSIKAFRTGKRPPLKLEEGE